MSVCPELSVLVEELFDIHSKWFRFGLQLKVPFPQLKGIEKSCGGDVEDAFCRMLEEWLRQEKKPSWAAVVKALRARTVNELRLADNLEYRFVAADGATPSPVDRQPVSVLQTAQGAKNWAAVPLAYDIPNQDIQNDIDQLHQAFEGLRMEIYSYLEETKPNLKEFAVFVSCPMPSWKTKRPKQMMDVDLDRIMQPRMEFYQMFCVVNQYTNWYNYELLDNIAQRYGNSELKGKMAAYRSQLAEFETHTSADELTSIELAKPLADSVSIIARLPDHHCNQFTASDVRQLKDGYANDAGLDHAALRTAVINESSVEIIFLVPVSLAPYLIVNSYTTSHLLTTQSPLPEDMHERCVHYMHAEEVFRLMGRTVTPPALGKVSSSSHTEQVQPSDTSVFSSISLSCTSFEMDEAFPPIDPSRIHIFHDKVLMNGDSAVVCKAQFLNLPCAAKYIHHKLVETSSWQMEMFNKGCKILQSCRHPNIVTFLGIYSDNRLKQPILLMELMDQSLKELLDHRKLDLPLYFQLDICSDVAQGLEYLHAKDIIHGNLTSANVLVKGGRAKIGGLMPLQVITPNGELSLCPGAPESMPRRSFSCADYDEAIDCFSFGVLGIHIATRELPTPRTRVQESREVERYEKDLLKVEEKKHPLYPLIIKCLNDEGNLRSSATKLCQQLASMIKSSAYRNSQAAGHVSTELVGLQVEYVQDRLSEKTEENKAQKRKQAELEATIESLRNNLTMMTLTNKDLTEKAEAATKELEKQNSEAAREKERMCRALWKEKDKTQTMNDKIGELEKARDDYKEKLVQSDNSLARMLSST